MEKLFSIKRDQFKMTFFRAGGSGGQKQNKTSSACRIVHIPSGAVGESRNFRHQAQNRKAAFERLAASGTFRKWLKIEAARHSGALARIERDVEEWLREDNLKIEGKTEEGTWSTESIDD